MSEKLPQAPTWKVIVGSIVFAAIFIPMLVAEGIKGLAFLIVALSILASPVLAILLVWKIAQKFRRPSKGP